MTNKTMNKKMSKRQKDIKSKLMAAICMLLVSSIMMVSTTYAWFTLSTAPEVTGITTAVGANGNLEMALLSPKVSAVSDLNDATKITSAVGDSKDASGKTLAEANITWGNLVDLQDTSVYGLDKITLLPAAINVQMGDDGETPVTDADGYKTLMANPLQRPVYGADGRVSELKSSDVLAGNYASGTFNVGGTSYYGVRGLGAASSMSPRQAEYRAVVQTAVSSTNAAKSDVSGSLSAEGDTLAAIAVKKANAKDGAEATYTLDDMKALQRTVAKLESSIAKIELAVKNYVVALNIAPAAQETTFEATKDAILGMTLTQIKDSTYTKPAIFDTVYEKLYGTNGTVGKVSAAKTTLDTQVTAAKASYAWADFSTALYSIMDPDKMELNGFAIKDLMAHKSEVANSVIKNGIQLAMPSNSGAYADLADFCGDYSAIILLPPGLEVEGIDLGGMEATMKTASTVTPPYMNTMNTQKGEFAAAEGGSTTNAITDFYGYIIDLAFRTNVADSKLQLATDALNRIYTDSTNEDIMGHGSSMTFTSAAGDSFPVPSVKNLMDHLRIVFFDPFTNKIYAEARLDTANAEVDGGAVTAKMYLFKNNALATGKGAESEDDDILKLEQNKAQALSALVYLDGTTITNADVANAMQSMTGSMNLQFSSSATLVPMNYSELKDGTGTGSAVTTITMNAAELDASAEDRGVKVLMTRALVDTSKTAVAVVLEGVPEGYDVKLSVGGAAEELATKKTYGGITGYGIEVTGTEITKETPVKVFLVASTGGGTTTTTYTVTVPTGVTGAASVEEGATYTFTVADGYTLGTVTMGDSPVTPTGDASGYSIANVTGNIVINVTAPADGG